MSKNSGPKKSKIISLFVTFAILFIVVFSLGVIIGKGLGDTDTPSVDRSYEEEVVYETPAEPEIDEQESSDHGSDLAETHPDEPVSEDEGTTDSSSDIAENAADADEKASDESDIVETQTLSEKPEPADPVKEPDSKDETKEEESQEVSLQESPIESKETPASENQLPKIDPSGRYTVQIGAYQDQSQANKVLTSMKSKGYPAFIKQVESPDDKTLYRVRVGTFTSKAQAAVYGNFLKEKESGIKSVYITVN